MNVCGKDIRVRGRLIRIAGLDADTYEFLDNPESTIESLRKCSGRIDLFTFMQRLPECSPKYRYSMVWDNLAALPVSTFDHWWERQIGKKTRNKARQAEKKGVVVREVAFDETLVHGIWRIYNESSVRQGKPFSHYGKSIEAVRKSAGTFLERSIFAGAFFGEELIGFTKLIMDETHTQAGLVHIISMLEHRDKAPANALIAQAVRSCAARGIPYLVYSRFSEGKKRRDSLIDFKEHNGFQRFDLPRYYIPLTRLGTLALHCGLHTNLIDHLPEPLVARLRQLRSAWYHRKLQSTAEAS